MFRIISLVLLVAFVAHTGCAKKASEREASDEKTGGGSTASKQPFSQHPDELVGIWWGTAALDEDALATAIKDQSPVEQERTVAAAEAFLATEIAIEFKPDGNMESAMEVQNRAGQREVGVEYAKWMASPMTLEREFKVQTTAEKPDGTLGTDQKIIRLSDSGDQIRFKVNVGGALGRCNAQFILERQGVETVAQESNGQIR